MTAESRRRYPDSSTLWMEFDDDPKPGSSKADAAVQVITADACVQTDEPFEFDDSPVRIQGSPPPLPTPRGSPEREYPAPAASVPPELVNVRPDEVAAANLPAVPNVIELSPEQRLVLDMVKTGKNVFNFTRERAIVHCTRCGLIHFLSSTYTITAFAIAYVQLPKK